MINRSLVAILIFVLSQLTGQLAYAGAIARNAQPLFDKGLAAYQTMNYKKAEKYWLRAADRDHVPSMYSLARMYQYGEVGKKDLDKAEHWYRKAAEMGAVPAQYQLGRLLYNRSEYAKAYEWISEAAKADNGDAQHDLALMYEEGKGVKQSIDEAASWYEKAAENGSAPAQFKLVLLYMNGTGVEKNNAKAFLWATKAAESGDPNAKYLLGYMYYSGTGTVQSLEMASIWLEEAVNEGQPKAQKLLDEVNEAVNQQYSSR